MTNSKASLIAHRGFVQALGLWFALLFGGIAAVVPSKLNAALLNTLGLTALTSPNGLMTGFAGKSLTVLFSLILGAVTGAGIAAFLRFMRRKRMERYSFRPSESTVFYDDTSDDVSQEYESQPEAEFAPSGIVDAEYEDILDLDEDSIILAPDDSDAGPDHSPQSVDIAENFEPAEQPELTPTPIENDVVQTDAETAHNDVETETSRAEPRESDVSQQPVAPTAVSPAMPPIPVSDLSSYAQTDSQSDEPSAKPQLDIARLNSESDPLSKKNSPPDIIEADTTMPDTTTRENPASKNPAPENLSPQGKPPIRNSTSLENLLDRLQAASGAANAQPTTQSNTQDGDVYNERDSSDPRAIDSVSSEQSVKQGPVLSDRLQAALDRLERARQSD